MIELTSVLADVAATNKPKEKMAAIENIDHESLRLILLAQSPFITFGVKKLPTYTSQDEQSAGQECLDSFFALADKLAARELTGHAAIVEIENVLSQYSRATAQTLEKVLKKNLRCNMGNTLINKVYKNHIPVFKCMLADRMSDRFDWTKGPWLVEYKYDGMRIVAQVTEDGIAYFSRSGQPQPKFEGLFDDFLYDVRTLLGYDFYMDGEVLAPTFQETMEARGGDGDTSNLVYRVFDYLSADDWNNQKCELGNLKRHIHLSDVMATATDQFNMDSSVDEDEVESDSFFDMGEVAEKKVNVVFTEGKICNTREELEEFYKSLVAVGAEGVVIKDINAPYHWKRNKAWTKYTPLFRADLQVVGRYEGEASKKYAGTLGGLELKGELEDGTIVRADCGTGFSDAQRDEIWTMDLDELVGRTVEIEYREVSQGKGKELPSLRFPSFKHFRVDK